MEQKKRTFKSYIKTFIQSSIHQRQQIKKVLNTNSKLRTLTDNSTLVMVTLIDIKMSYEKIQYNGVEKN